MTALEEFGLRPVINAGGTATRLGGGRLDPEVVAAMAEAAQVHLPIERLQERAGELIAEVTGAEAGYVTAGASAGLVLGMAACLAGLDPVRMDALPGAGSRTEVIIQRGHRNAYDHALRQAGAAIVEVGYEGFPGAGRTWPWQIEAAISERTAAIAHPVQLAPGTVPLLEVTEIAHRHGLPVIVDASAALPPVDNLGRFIGEGADLVAFSGGKAIGGPQGSGILAGRADLIRSVALQHQDMDVNPAVWRYRGLIAEGKLEGPPHHGIGRPMKVGKETIVALMVALRRFAASDQTAEMERQVRILERIRGFFEGSPGVETVLRLPGPEARPAYPLLVVDLGGPPARGRASQVIRDLEEDDPPIHLSQAFLDAGQLGFIASTLRDDEADVVGERLRALLVDVGEPAESGRLSR